MYEPHLTFFFFFFSNFSDNGYVKKNGRQGTDGGSPGRCNETLPLPGIILMEFQCPKVNILLDVCAVLPPPSNQI